MGIIKQVKIIERNPGPLDDVGTYDCEDASKNYASQNWICEGPSSDHNCC